MTFQVSSFPPGSAMSRVSGGGMGDVEAWIKWGVVESPDPVWTTALAAGVKWPTGKWDQLDATVRGMDQTGTGTTDLSAAVSCATPRGAHQWWGELRYTLTLQRTEPDQSGAIRVDPGDTASVSLAWQWAVSDRWSAGAVLAYHNTSRTRRGEEKLLNTDSQWLVSRLGLVWRPQAQVSLLPQVEFPLFATNRLALTSFFLAIRQEL